MSSSKTRHAKVAKHEWHALPLRAVFEALDTNENGLSDTDVKERKEIYGENVFTEAKQVTLFTRLFLQFKNPLTVVLLLALFLTLALGEYLDSSVILFALLTAVVLGLLQEGKASRAFEKLAASQIKTARVIRDGKQHEILAQELVPGDMVVIQNGMQVPADIRIIESKNLSINEASLTGEWLAAAKGEKRIDVGTPLAEISSMAHLGTFVSTGQGKGVVVATGDDTLMGSLARDLKEIIEEITPIQWEMARISRFMLLIVVVLIVAIFLIGLLAGEGIEIMLLTSIAIAVAAIPEGLPAAVTIILAVGMEALLRRGGLVRNLLAAETLGSTTYVLTDKTGTLTEARMAITDVVYLGCLAVDKDDVCDWKGDEHAKRMFDIALCASDAFLDEHKDGDELYVVRGEPMERAVLEAAQEVGITMVGESARAHRIDFLAFESENRFAAGLAEVGSKRLLCINGAPELLLEHATGVMTSDSEVHMTKKHRAFFKRKISTYTGDGKRLIAVAYKHVSFEDIPEPAEELLSDVVFAGLLIITDPVRKDVKEAIRGVMRAGAQIRLVTGDNPKTALSVAREVGITREHDIALTGDDIAKLSDDELLEVVQTTRVFARILPRQKMRLAQILQMSGEVVAMTGDGINDAPALRKADIGVALGSGTEVAKESSDLVLVNDTFSTIYAAIEEGRRIIENLRKIVGYLLATSLSESVLIGGALITGGALPLLPAQILWANIIEEGLMSVAFAFEPGDKEAMREKPRDIHEDGVLSHEMLMFGSLVVGVLGVLLMSLYAYLRILEVPIEEMRSIMFLAVALDSMFIAFSFRSLKVPVWKIPLHTNVFFIVAFVISLILLVVILSVPFFQYLLSYEPLPLFDFILVFLYGLFSMAIIEVGKWLFLERKQ